MSSFQQLTLADTFRVTKNASNTVNMGSKWIMLLQKDQRFWLNFINDFRNKVVFWEKLRKEESCFEKCDVNRKVTKNKTASVTKDNIFSIRRIFAVLLVCIVFVISPQVDATSIQFSETFWHGVINVDLAFYTDSTYSQKYTVLPVLNTAQLIYGEVFTNVPVSSEVKIVILSYWATSTSSANDPTNLVIVENPGCATIALPSINVNTNGQTSRVRFSNNVFQFRGSSTITLHFAIQLCEGSCQPNCPARRRRQSDEETLEDGVRTISQTLQIETTANSFHQFLPSQSATSNTTTEKSESGETSTNNGVEEPDKLAEDRKAMFVAIISALSVLTVVCLAIAVFIWVRQRQLNQTQLKSKRYKSQTTEIFTTTIPK